MLVFGDKGLLELHRLRLESAAVERGNQELRKRNQELARRVASLRGEPAEIERLARERLGMIKEGEVVYYLPREVSGPARQ